MLRLRYPKAFSAATCSRWVATRRATTTWIKKADTARKMEGRSVPSTRCSRISLSSMACEVWSRRSTAGRPPTRANCRSITASTGAPTVWGASWNATWLNAPPISSAAARAVRSTQNTPKPRASGIPQSPAKMYSGDSAIPVMRTTRWRPLISACTWSPARRPWAMAKPSDTSACHSAPPLLPANGHSPERRLMRFSAAGRCASSPMNWPTTESVLPGTVTRAGDSTVVWRAAMPGSARRASPSESGARLSATNTSAKRPCA